jgi:hypothetical protein
MPLLYLIVPARIGEAATAWVNSPDAWQRAGIEPIMVYWAGVDGLFVKILTASRFCPKCVIIGVARHGRLELYSRAYRIYLKERLNSGRRKKQELDRL